LAIDNAQEYYDSILGGINEIKKYQQLVKIISNDFEDDFLNEFDFKDTKRVLKGELSSFFRYVNKQYYSTKGKFRGYLKNDEYDLNYKSMLKLCDDALKSNDLKIIIH
jgi:hypothetical protein